MLGDGRERAAGKQQSRKNVPFGRSFVEDVSFLGRTQEVCVVVVFFLFGFAAVRHTEDTVWGTQCIVTTIMLDVSDHKDRLFVLFGSTTLFTVTQEKESTCTTCTARDAKAGVKERVFGAISSTPTLHCLLYNKRKTNPTRNRIASTPRPVPPPYDHTVSTPWITLTHRAKLCVIAANCRMEFDRNSNPAGATPQHKPAVLSSTCGFM